MAFCRKCGVQLRDGIRFCSSCGSPTDVVSVNIESAQSPQSFPQRTVSTTRSTTAPTVNGKKKSTTSPIIIIGIVFFALLLLCIISVVIPNMLKNDSTSSDSTSKNDVEAPSASIGTQAPYSGVNYSISGMNKEGDTAIFEVRCKGGASRREIASDMAKLIFNTSKTRTDINNIHFHFFMSQSGLTDRYGNPLNGPDEDMGTIKWDDLGEIRKYVDYERWRRASDITGTGESGVDMIIAIGLQHELSSAYLLHD